MNWLFCSQATQNFALANNINNLRTGQGLIAPIEAQILFVVHAEQTPYLRGLRARTISKRLKRKAGLSVVDCTANALQNSQKGIKANQPLFNFLIYNLLRKKLIHINSISYRLLSVPLRLNLKML